MLKRYEKFTGVVDGEDGGDPANTGNLQQARILFNLQALRLNLT